ncbi:Na/Pi-cotransporter [Alicyclobacillus cellulosilyticus]|uniref:Na/Pi-cotransporter n=1 Tax=Alicyclobacillus cellulosilyticus TaxID=1003997 RepID=A0A917NLJ7_9BACL|nr:Na/Pi symporter [Alicyclobacillus cellulosilyticus]GGJ09315.1 Na/Pi-cotransporter [Alicyclobacillus cellulosilyticus]
MFWNLTAAAAALLGFLGGLHLLRTGLAHTAGQRLERLIHHLVRTPTRGILTGTAFSALLQSSAAVTAIAVGLVASGRMTFADAIGIVLGANVGSTVTPQLLTLNLLAVAVPCLVLGALGLTFASSRWRNPCIALFGFAAMVISLETLDTALTPVAQTGALQAWLRDAAESELWAAWAGCLASAILQSSTATTIITMTLAAQHAIPLTGAIATVLGANVGSCVTSVLAAIGQSRPAQRVALSHVLLNAVGVCAVLPLVHPFAAWMAAWADEPAQQVANAHTVFNVVCTLAAWPLARPYARFVEHLLPDRANAGT